MWMVKKRVREFYAMSPEQAYSILETIAVLGGRKDRLHLYEPSADEKKSENLAQEIEEEHIERLSPFAFSKCKIPVGATITLIFLVVLNLVSGDSYHRISQNAVVAGVMSVLVKK